MKNVIVQTVRENYDVIQVQKALGALESWKEGIERTP